MFTVDQLYELSPNLLSEHHYTYLPKICIYCDNPIILNLDRTIMRCSNSRCPKHMSFRAHEMLESMGVKGIGDATAYKMIKENDLQNHMDILSLTVEQMPKSSSLPVRQDYYNSLKQGRQQTLGKILSMYKIEGIGETHSNAIMNDFNSFEDFFTKLDNPQDMIEHFRKALKQVNITRVLREKVLRIRMAKDDLLRVEKYFEVVKLAEKKLRISITGEILTIGCNILPMKPRTNFIKALNMKYKDIISFVDANKNLSEAFALVTDSTENTGKYADALRFNTSIYNFRDFVDLIESTYGTGDEAIQFTRKK